MTKLWTNMHDLQDINLAEKGISFTEEAFTGLFDQAVEAGLEHVADVKIATGKGALIGAAGVGVLWLSVVGIKKFRNRRKPNVKKNGEPNKAPKKVKETELDSSEVNDIIKNAKKLSKKDREALANIITEINENSKVH